LQARVPRKHATYRRYRTARTDTGLRCGAWRGVATNDHTKKVSLYKTVPRPTARLHHVCMCIQCSFADGQGASTQAGLHRVVRTAQGGAGFCADASGAKEHRQEAGGRDRRSKSFGARAARRVLPRGEEGCVHTTWRAGSGSAEAARQAGVWSREGRWGER
jgi:hypothetical protein